ncbi:hypothetical protein CXB49_10750 [Chromobacterium sp. ATCC 53434]|uniref:DUF5658 family protein n=1 Tax=Chromobacterium sp. (strain ATCC 53434 / SC 14030) TaxID=2059672 RepID=UPI000C765DE8|nr:DUF5658 family protein [Chromobacterium sp. ATCC 53434]AUH51254.1 hypothetical protein CXB49_10750 [Chromobacterium sp. ATCC 53434]
MIWIALLVLLQAADIASTFYALTYLGGRELNPFVRRLIERAGILPALVAVKALLFLACCLLKPPPLAYQLLCVFYAFILLSNLRAINKGRDNRP